MTRPRDYLAIPEAYSRRLGGIRWGALRDAVEYDSAPRQSSRTFALAGEVALFLEGFGAVAPPVCFGFVLQLLDLLGLGTRGGPGTRPGRPDRLARAFREAGGPLRNAGALAATLCQGLPRAAGSPDVRELALTLNRGGWACGRAPGEAAEVPPLEPAAFEAHLLSALGALSDDDLMHWLRHGRGPVGRSGEAVAAIVPPGLAATLADLERRPRLAGASTLVPTLAGALALPPRRLAHAEQPTGGYADVATRGLPEQILPGQFALDPEEFLRRFAERELLYFHREEPHARASEELVLMLDQGVRTWGDVRLVLAASALALGRQAARRGLPLLIAATSNGGAIVPAREAGREALGALLEASDLTPHPGRALARVLDEPADLPRDVVLLTHPRSLAEPEVADSARRLATGTRLFAVAVDGEGRVELSEVRRGAPVVQSRCRVAVRAPSALPPEPPAPSAAPWRGDVEPIGFPFRIGPLSPIDERLVTFDDSGDWLLAVGLLGMLHLWRADGSATETLPRAMFEREPLASVEAVLGVVGGFVVVGRMNRNCIVAHYDLAGRTVTARGFPPHGWGAHSYQYIRSHHAVVVSRTDSAGCWAFDLGTHRSASISAPDGPAGATALERAQWALALGSAPERNAPAVVAEGVPMPARGRALRLSPEAGTLDIQNDAGLWQVCRPLVDGRPALKGGKIVRARSGGDVIGALVALPGGQRTLFLFSAGSFRTLGAYPVGADVADFILSPDGRRLARRFGKRHLEVRDVSGGMAHPFVTAKGKAHPRLAVGLGESCLTIQTGKFVHLIDWSRESLLLAYSQGDAGRLVARVLPWVANRPASLVPLDRPGLGSYDGRRFIAVGSAFGLKVLVDPMSQVAVLDPADDAVVCLFYAFREQLAAWLPDGTRLGPAPLIGGHPTPGGADRIASALRAAAARGRGGVENGK